MSKFSRILMLAVCASTLWMGVGAHAEISKEALSFTESGVYLTENMQGDLRLHDTMNRAEFAHLVVRSLDLVSGGSCDEGHVQFSDVTSQMWFGEDVCLMADLGLMRGYEDGTFRAGNAVSFAEVAKVLTLVTGGASMENGSRDLWFEPYVEYLSSQHAIPTSVTSLVQPITRGEFMDILYRLKMQDASLESNAYSSESKCILVKMDRFYAKTTHSVYFYMPREEVVFGSGGLLDHVPVLSSGSLIQDADAGSFMVLELPFYAKDRSQVYYMGMKLSHADAQSFEVVDTQYGYAKDKSHAYFQGMLLEGSDAESFVDLGAYFAKDKFHVYRLGKIFDAADVATFTVLSTQYARDGVQAYYLGKPMLGSHGDSFVVDNVSFAHDLSGAYFTDVVIAGADSNYFTVLKDHFSHDLYSVFFETEMLSGVSPEEFVVLEDFYGKTVDYVYYGAGRVEGADVKSFSVVGKGYAKDYGNVYYKGQKITADSASMSISKRGVVRDKSGILHAGKHTY